jgi:hypothetical protein
MAAGYALVPSAEDASTLLQSLMAVGSQSALEFLGE